jgi:hypothetical protein
MSTNISARNFSLVINGIDRTANVIGVSLSQNELGDSGVFTSGEITLQANYSEIADFTYLSSPSIAENWARGASVVYQIANDSGVLTNFLMSGAALYILKEPAPPDSNYQIKIQVGDEATLKNYRTADSDPSEITAGVSTARNTVIERYLSAAGVTKSIGSIPYPFTFPQPKTQGNSLAEVAAQMTRSAGHILYTNPLGTLVNKAIDFDAPAIASFTIGEDEQLFEQIDGSGIETPVDELVISGLATEIDSTAYPRINVQAIRFPTTVLINNEVRQINYISKRTTITDYGWDGSEERVVVLTESSTLYLQFAELLINNEAAFLSPINETTTIKRYDSKNRLILEREETDFFFGTNARFEFLGNQLIPYGLNPSFSSVRYDAFDIQTTYTYDDETDELISKREERTNYLLVDNRGFAFNKVAKEENWNNGFYSIVNYFQQNSFTSSFIPPGSLTRIPADRLIINQGEWQTGRSDSTYSTDGSTKAPATVYRKPFEPIERQITATIKSIPFAGQSFYSRSRPIDVPYLESQAQATEYGNTYLKLLYGRKQGFVFATAINNTLLAFLTPLSKLSITWRGTVYDCLVDGITWVHTQTEMILGMRLIVIKANGLDIVDLSALIEATLSQRAEISCRVIGEQFVGGTLSQSGFISCFVQEGVIIAAQFSQSATITCTVS